MQGILVAPEGHLVKIHDRIDFLGLFPEMFHVELKADALGAVRIHIGQRDFLLLLFFFLYFIKHLSSLHDDALQRVGQLPIFTKGK